MRKLTLVAAMALAMTTTGRTQSSPRLLVLNKDDATVAIVDPESGRALGRVPTGEGPHELVVSTDGKVAYASNYGTGPAPGHTISMVDIAAQKELRRIDVTPLSRPHGLAFGGGKLYFTAEGSRKIGRYDPAANKVDWEFETGQNTTHMVLPTKDLHVLFTSNIGSNSVSAIEHRTDGSWTQSVIPVGKGPEGIDLSPDGRHVWSAHSQDGGVSVIDVSKKRVVRTIDLGTKRSNRIKLTPDGKFALVSDLAAGELVVVDTVAGTVVKRMPLGRQPEGILIQPDGSRAFIAVNGDNIVAVVDMKTWSIARRISPGNGPDGLAWIP